MSLNGRPFAVTRAVKRIARNVSQQGVGADTGNHESVQIYWTRSGTNVLLGRRSRQGDRQIHRRSLDPDGCLARFVAAMI